MALCCHVFLLVALVGNKVTTLRSDGGIPATNTGKIDIYEWALVGEEGKTLLFRNGSSFETNLFDLKYIGELKTRRKAPYLILSGRSCEDCDENISIYIWSPDDGKMRPAEQQARYSYPGKEEDYFTNESTYECRMFYGNCLEAESCIWIQRSIDSNKNWDSSVFIVQVQNDTLQEIMLRESAELEVVLREIVKCSELPGIVFTTEP